jgi:hypothetical protein
VEQGGGRVANGDNCACDVGFPKFDSGGGSGVADFRGVIRGARIVKGDDDLVIGGQVAADDARADHFAIAQDRRARVQSVMARKCHIGRKRQAVGDFDHAAAVDQAGDEGVKGGGETVQTCLGCDRREAGGVDG